MEYRERIIRLIDVLNKASDHYYNNTPVMSDYDWDQLYEELKQLEAETGIIYPNSPTQNVGYVISDELREVQHNHPMLSLDKTKSADELLKFAGDKKCVLSVKCDGLTCSLHYIGGELISAETRGNGVRGQDVLQNVLVMSNVPKQIPYKDELIIDGEVIIGWDTFRKINATLLGDEKYKHPRNLVSGSLQLLDSRQAKERNMKFIAWRVIKGFEHQSVFDDLYQAKDNGFEIVPMFTFEKSDDENYLKTILGLIKTSADACNIPYDGAVMAVDDYAMAESMGRTDKFFRHSIAFKYEDQLYETVLNDIEWNTSKTGLINPVAIFDPVDLDGAVTTRATLHNITYIKDKMLGIGDRIRVYRSNMVIPKVHDSIDKSGKFTIPNRCPICEQPTKIVKDNDSEVLYCTNEDCKGRLSGKLVHSVSRNALNIDGLSEATIEKFIDLGWLNSIKDIYHLSDYKSKMETLEGFGKKSVDNLLNSIEKSRKTDLQRFLYSLSIPLLGKSASKDIAKACDDGNYDFGNFMKIMTTTGAKYFKNISGVGDSLVSSMDSYFDRHCPSIYELSKELTFEQPKKRAIVVTGDLKDLSGQTFVITGSLEHFPNRDAAKEQIEALGGKVGSSVNSKTTYLVNNDPNSSSSKNKKAKELGIPIISEVQLLSMIS